MRNFREFFHSFRKSRDEIARANSLLIHREAMNVFLNSGMGDLLREAALNLQEQLSESANPQVQIWSYSGPPSPDYMQILYWNKPPKVMGRIHSHPSQAKVMITSWAHGAIRVENSNGKEWRDIPPPAGQEENKDKKNRMHIQFAILSAEDSSYMEDERVSGKYTKIFG